MQKSKYRFFLLKIWLLVINVVVMKQTVTIETADTTVMQLLQNLAAMSLLKITPETPSRLQKPDDDHITVLYNEIYNEVDSSLDSCIVKAQAETVKGDVW